MIAKNEIEKLIQPSNQFTPTLKRPLKVVGVMMVKKESDIIRASVTNNLRFCDSLRILDNGSKDDTFAILKNLASEGWAVNLCQDNRFSYEQSEKVTALYHEAANHDCADIVIPLDADEFIQAPDVNCFREALASIPEQGIGYWNWRNYLPWNLNSLKLNERFSRYQQSQNVKIVIRVPPRHVCSRDKISQGSHRLFRPHSNPPEVYLPFDSIYLAHFPVRSIQQIVSKALAGWMATRVASGQRGCFHWKALCDEIMDGKSFDRNWLIWQALDYASRDIASSPPPEGAESHALAVSHPSSLQLSPDLELQGPVGDRIDWQAIAQLVFLTWEDSLDQEHQPVPSPDSSSWRRRLRQLWHKLK